MQSVFVPHYLILKIHWLIIDVPSVCTVNRLFFVSLRWLHPSTIKHACLRTMSYLLATLIHNQCVSTAHAQTIKGH